jgi:hypothetical protein
MSSVENILANATAEQIAEVRDWASDCIGLSAGVKVGAERAIAYVERNYPGGWDAFVSECCSPKKETPAPVSSYTHCACRDCMDVTVSSNPARPELCELCHAAGCGDPDATTWPECQRDDAYDTDESERTRDGYSFATGELGGTSY